MGSELGAFEGAAVGVVDGWWEEGVLEGARLSDGAVLGALLGVADGTWLGSGLAVGALEGLALGMLEGAIDGEALGAAVGAGLVGGGVLGGRLKLKEVELLDEEVSVVVKVGSLSARVVLLVQASLLVISHMVSLFSASIDDFCGEDFFWASREMLWLDGATVVSRSCTGRGIENPA